MRFKRPYSLTNLVYGVACGASACLSVAIFLSAFNAVAFPDTLRHGYTSCTACHLSPGGGGLMSDYGRSLARELLSTWSYENEEKLLHGAVPETWVAKNIALGGDVRYLAARRESNGDIEEDRFLMQAQMRVGVVWEQLKFLMSVGKIENPKNTESVALVSPEYFVLWSPKDEVHVRAGRFEPVYGLRMADHNLWMRSELGFVPWRERDSIEFVYDGDLQLASFSGYQSTSATMVSQQMTGYMASFHQLLNNTSRVGVSALNAEGQGSRLKTATIHGLLSFSEYLYAMIEVTRLWSGDVTKDLGFVRAGYEITKGLTSFVQAQAKMVLTPLRSDQSKFGGGIICLPRPHFELMGTFDYTQSGKDHSHEELLLIHYYF